MRSYADVMATALALGAVLTIPLTGSVARAQEQEPQPEQRECECRAPWADQVRVWQRAGMPPSIWWLDRGVRLGIRVEGETDPETDSIGARIEAVLPGGPAEEAGLQAGDIITRLDGRSLTSGGEAYDADVSAPARRLVERARALDPGDTVSVEYRRGDETRTTTLVATGPGDDRVRMLPAPPAPPGAELRRLGDRLRDLPQAVRVTLRSRLAGLDLALLNEGLGEYFGTDEGVLVLAVPEEGDLGLQPGDVIRKIDGREARDPAQVRRILRSYTSDEEITFEIVRKRKTTTVRGRVPSDWDPSPSWQGRRNGESS